MDQTPNKYSIRPPQSSHLIQPFFCGGAEDGRNVGQSPFLPCVIGVWGQRRPWDSAWILLAFNLKNFQNSWNLKFHRKDLSTKKMRRKWTLCGGNCPFAAVTSSFWQRRPVSRSGFWRTVWHLFFPQSSQVLRVWPRQSTGASPENLLG